MHGAEDFHQRGFARAVLAAQRNDFAAPDLKADVVERNHAGKALADSAISRSGVMEVILVMA